MANKYWWGFYPGSEGSYSTANNWSGGSAPSANDDVFILPGSSSITSGLDATATAIDTFTVFPGYMGTIGTPGAFLLLDCDEQVIYCGSGDAYINTSDRQLAYMRIEQPESATGTLYHISGTSGGTADTQEIELFRGRFDHISGDIGLIKVSHRANPLSDSTYYHRAGTVTQYQQMGGFAEQFGGTISLGEICPGTMTVHDGTFSTAVAISGTATLDFRTTTDPTSLVVGGSATLTFANDERTKTITTVTAYGTPTIIRDNGAGNVTITNLVIIGNPTII